MADLFDNLTVTIPLPSHEKRRRGLSATTTYGSKIYMRCHNTELAQIDAAAAILGLTRSQYMRWCALYAAREIQRRAKEK